MLFSFTDTLFACPCCGHPKKMTPIISGNFFGASLWSDGVGHYPMLLSDPDIIKCELCNSFFWFKDRLDIEIKEHSKIGMKISKVADKVTQSTVLQYYEAIESNFCKSKEIEKKLRIAAWRRWNDTLRGYSDRTMYSIPNRRELWKYNLTELLKLLDENKDEESVIKAEILRNLGRFDEAKILLKKNHNPKYHNLITQILEFCNNRESSVKRIKFSNKT